MRALDALSARLQTLSFRERVLVGACLLCVAGFAAARWGVLPAWEEYRKNRAAVPQRLATIARYEATIADLDEAQRRTAVLREELSTAGETLQILKELTDRIPNGSWVQSVRVDGPKVELDGLSPSAAEIFPALTRDGRFRSVEFAAPITRQADNIERFKIRGEYVPPPVAPAMGGAQ